MRKDALTDTKAKTWSTGELGQILRRHASVGLDNDEALSPSPETQEPKPLSLSEELTLSLSEMSERGINALMSGTRSGYGAHSKLYYEPTFGENEEDEEKKKRKEHGNLRTFTTNMETLNINGISMSTEEASDHLASAKKRLLKTQNMNTEAAQLNVTTAELKALSKTDDACVIVDGKPIEDIAIVDGRVVDTQLYYKMEIANQELAEKYELAEQFSVQLEAGEVTWEQAPEEIHDLIAQEHEIRENGLEKKPEEPKTVLDQLNEMGAEMQQIQTVKPTVSYAPTIGF